MAAAAMASLANIVTSAVLWIAPAYAAVLMVKPDVVDSDRRDWRRNLTIQMLAVGAVGFIFLVDRLPAVFSSTQQYGTGVSSLRESLAGLINFLRFLFPVPIWSAVAAIGAVGLAAMSWQSGLRWLAAIGLAVVAVDGAYLLQVARLPYPRVMFHLIPVVLLGVGYAITRLSDRAGAGSVWPGAVATLVALMVVRLAQPVHAAYDDQMRSLVQRTLSSYAPNDPPTYPVIGPGVDAPALGHQLPEKWLDTDMRIPDGVPLQLAVFVRQTDDWKMEVLSRPGAPHRWYPATWAPADAKASSDIGYRLMLVRGDTYAWPVRSSTVPRRVVFWYPDADRLNASPSTATAIIAASNLRYFEIQKRRTIKVNLYGTLFAVAVITESPQEVASADEAIGAAIAKFGGTAVAFIDGDQPRP
jgi:hypothetical protein